MRWNDRRVELAQRRLVRVGSVGGMRRRTAGEVEQGRRGRRGEAVAGWGRVGRSGHAGIRAGQVGRGDLLAL